MNTQPHAAQRQRQGQSQTPQTATSPAVPLYFMGESEDRPPLPQRQYSQSSVVDQGRQSRHMSIPAANHPIATSTSRPPTTQAEPRHNNLTAASTISSNTTTLQQLIKNIVVDQGASVSRSTPPDANQVIPNPLNPEWGLPGPNQISSDEINCWIYSVRDAYAGGHAGLLADSCHLIMRCTAEFSYFNQYMICLHCYKILHLNHMCSQIECLAWNGATIVKWLPLGASIINNPQRCTMQCHKY